MRDETKKEEPEPTREQLRRDYERQLAALLDRASDYGVQVFPLMDGNVCGDELVVKGLSPNVGVFIDWAVSPQVI